MKNRKWVLCSGLAFYDKEDMEMLHQYALEGWVFREFKGLFYVLHKEEPKDIIFDYHYQPLAPGEEEEYYAVFENAGWHPISTGSKDFHFFWAPNGTVPLHTDKATEGEQFRKIAQWSLVACIASFAVFLASYFLLPKTWEIVRLGVIILALAIMAGAGICFIGCFLRTKQKRLNFDISFKSAVLLFFVFVLSYMGIMLFIPKAVSDINPWVQILSAICGGGIGLTLVIILFKFRQYRDGKVK